MTTLIIGGAGFVGPYLAERLKTEGSSVYITKLPSETFPEGISVDGIFDLDLMNQNSIDILLASLRPSVIFHLAAQSSVAISWKQPSLTIDVNIKGCMHLLDAVRSVPSYRPRVMLIGSSEEYGAIDGELPINEDAPQRPENPYAITKCCQNMIGNMYVKAYDSDIVMIRAFNHIGPRQLPQFVLPDFCRQIAEMECGQRMPLLEVGNLSAKRDFTDVRDIVYAYILLAKHGKQGETYNVGSGHAIAIEELLQHLLTLSTTSVEVCVSADKFRPVDVPVIEADISKLQSCTGWAPEHSIHDTISDVLNEWRHHVKASSSASQSHSSR